MNIELTIDELDIDDLDAVSGGAEMTAFQAVYAGLVKGFLDAGGEVTCVVDGKGVIGCAFKA